MKIKDKKGKALKVGKKVVWHDPEDSVKDLSRVYKVNKIINEEVILISDEFSEAEVCPNELEVV